MNLDPDMCFCGEPLHYTDPVVQNQVKKLIESSGRMIDITVVDVGTFKVDRHFIALHGIKGEELPSLGFERVE